jgi:hypothetical protein
MGSLEPEYRLDEQQKVALAALSRATGKPWRVILSEALSTYQRTVQSSSDAWASTVTVADAMRSIGLLGSIKDAPTDLSTNPAYMDGFGKHGD